ncbi:MAG TPA: glycosyltransferase family 4 protein, partial [Armatimonadota bacterium]|nr:glycosyltransferase family 4 protein [Armatimonadota bacterium]
MRVAMFSECYEPTSNGVVVSMQSFLRELEARGHEVFVFAPAYRGHRDTAPRVYRFPSIPTPFNRDYPLALPFPRLPRGLERWGLDVVHTQHPFTMGKAGREAGRRLGIPVVYTFHTLLTEYTHYVPFFQDSLKRLARRSIRRYCNSVDHVITPTQVVADLLREYGVETPVTPVATGIAMPEASPGARSRIRSQWGIADGAFLAIYAGRVAKEKRLDMLIDAFGRVRARAEAKLLIVGGGPAEAEIAERVRSAGLAPDVTLTGRMPREVLPEYYAAADVFVYPSNTDTQALVLVEAMCLGLPCVAVRAFGPAEVVTDGASGLLVEFDAEALAHAVVRLADDPDL